MRKTMSNIPAPQQIYKHFKGNLYRIVALAEHSETGEQLVVYQALYGEFKIYARPLSLFLEKVDKEKYPDARQEYRFELQKELISGEAPVSKETVSDTEEIGIDPLVLEFLDAGTHEERLNILTALRPRITDDMINTMAIAAGVEIDEGELQERFLQLKNCLLTFDKYECSRLR